MTIEWDKKQALTSEEIFRREHDSYRAARKTVEAPVYFPKDGTTNVAPVSVAVTATSATLTMERNKVYRLASTVNAHFKLSSGGASAATSADIILPANTPMLISSGDLWDTVNIIRQTTSGLAQIVETK